MKLFLTCLLVLPAFAFAQETVNYVKRTNKKIDFQMEIPNYMEVTTELDEDRPFQYMHLEKEHYIVASYEDLATVEKLIQQIDPRDVGTLEKYADYNWTVLEENVAISSREEVVITTISGMEARIYEFDGTVEGVVVPITYTIAFIKGKKNIYFIMAWTLQSEKETFAAIADKMIRSFRLK
jgi:hypothetical protein